MLRKNYVGWMRLSILSLLMAILTACADNPVKPVVIDPKITEAMMHITVENFAAKGDKGTSLATAIKTALQYEGIKLAEDESGAVLRGKIKIDPIRTKCANSTDPKVSVHLCDRDTYFTVDYRLFDQKGNILLTSQAREGVLESEMSNTSVAEATAKLKSEDAIVHDAFQVISKKIVKRLLQR